MNYREKMREYVKSPRNGSAIKYGKWCALTPEQTNLITRLLDEMDSADKYIKKLYFENKQLKDNWNKLKKHIETCLNETKQNDIYDRSKYETGVIAGLDSSLYKMQELESGDSNE